MTIDELKKICDNSPKGNGAFDLDDVFKIQQKVKLQLDMDRDKQIYYYKIDESTLNNSVLDEKDIKEMLKKNWRFLSDKNLFIKII